MTFNRDRKAAEFDQSKEVGTVQLFNAKAPLEHVGQTHRQTRAEGSAAVVVEGQVAQLARALGEPDAEIFSGELLSQIPSLRLKEILRLSCFLPVIVLIPRSGTKAQVAAYKSSAATLSSEGCHTTKLFGVLGKAVERFNSTGAESIFAFGDVTVNFSAMEVLCKGEHLVLTTREFKTLKYLIQNARRVISRDELLKEVWGYRNYPCTRTVDTHIHGLRKKLERDPSRPVHFRTVFGAGYKFLP